MTSAPQPTDYPDVVETVRATDTREEFVPYIPPHVEMRELTPIPVIVGTLLGMIFGASSLYLVLKVGITVSVSMPAIMILGFDLEITRVMLVAILGGLLGILMMIPLRRALIVNQHGLLKYPEGTACAEVLKAGASRESLAAAHTDEASARVADEATTGGKIIFAGFGLGFLYYGL